MRKPPAPGSPPEPDPPGGRALERARDFAASRGLPEPQAPAAPAPAAPEPPAKTRTAATDGKSPKGKSNRS